MADDLIATLNHLLQLDHDAIGAYSTAIDRLKNPTLAETLRAYRGEHERRIRELNLLVREQGGTPVDSARPGRGRVAELLQRFGAVGGDAGVLLAFKAHEREVRDAYRDASQRFGEPGVAGLLNRAAADEGTHYGWALRTLDEMGYGPGTGVGRAGDALERGRARLVHTFRRAESDATRVARRARRDVGERLRRNPLGAALLAVGAGVVLGTVFRGRR